MILTASVADKPLSLISLVGLIRHAGCIMQ